MTHLSAPRLFWLASVLAAATPCGSWAAQGAGHPVNVTAVRFAHQPLSDPPVVAGEPNLAGLEFITDARPAPSFGFSRDRWWAVFALPTERPGPLFVKLDAPSADRVRAFMQCAAASWTELGRIAARYAVFRAEPSERQCEVALFEESRAPIRFGLEVLNPEMLARSDDTTFIGMALGVSLAVSAMIAVLWAATRGPELVHFLAYQAASALVIIRIWGFVPGLAFASHPAVGGLMGIAGLNLWVTEFLAYVRCSVGFRTSHPQADRIVSVLAASAWLAIAGEALGLRFQWPLTIANMGTGLACWILVIVLKWRTDRERAIQQLVGYAPTILCFLLYLGSVRGGVPLVEVRPLLLLGQVGSTLSLAFWMAQRFKRDQDIRETMLSTTVGQLEANRTELEHYHGDLETMVSSRTAELQRALQSERAIVAQQRDFTAMIGHEFRTPLAVIDGQARRIGRVRAVEDDVLRRSREIRDAVADMISLMDGLLFHARSDGGTAEYRFETVALKDVVRRAVETALPRGRQADLHVDPITAVHCRADETLLITALGNIVSNAAKYSDAGTAIAIEFDEHDQMLELRVRDQGKGIATSEMEAVFARFQRGTNALTSIGSGLGLYVARKIIEGHGGRISVESRQGKGSCFTLLLPRMAAAVEDKTAGNKGAT
jgi:signal transduction histidine kinase